MTARRKNRKIVLVAACFLLTVSALGAARTAHPECTVGADKNFAWQRIDINAARKLGKPILLYIYDPRGGKPHIATRHLQLEIFANAGVKRAFSEFTPVIQSVSATNWPPEYTAQGRDGAALLIMTCDAKPVAVFTHLSLPKAVKEGGNMEYAPLREAANLAVKANPKALEAMRKSPPPDYVSPEQLAAQRETAQAPAQDSRADALSALLNDPKAGGGEKKNGANTDNKSGAKNGNEVE